MNGFANSGSFFVSLQAFVTSVANKVTIPAKCACDMHKYFLEYLDTKKLV